MTSYDTLTNANYDESNVNVERIAKNGKFHRMLKYWRNSSRPVGGGLKKSTSFIEYRKPQTNVIYQRLDSYDESKLEKLR